MHSQLCTHKTLLRTDTSTLLRLDNFSARGRQCPGTLATMHSLLAAPPLLHGAVYLSICLSVCYRSIYGCSALATRSCLSICLSLCVLSVYLWLLHTCSTEQPHRPSRRCRPGQLVTITHALTRVHALVSPVTCFRYGTSSARDRARSLQEAVLARAIATRALAVAC